MSKPLQIGVTGGIGSGKSIVCKVFNCLGIPIYEADVRAKWLTNNDLEIRKNVTELLGSEAYTAEGRYDTAFVSAQVFNNESLLKSLNAIVHPAVMKDTADWVKKHESSAYVMKEAAIMNKAGEGNALDFVIVVEAPEAVRIERILRRDHRTEEEIRAIIRRQVSEEARRQVADFLITNDDQSALIPQVMQLHKHFLKLASAG